MSYARLKCKWETVGICALEAIIFQCKHETGPVMNNSNVVGYVIRLWNHSLKLFFTV